MQSANDTIQGQNSVGLNGILAIQNDATTNQIRYITLSDLASIRPALISNNNSGINVIRSAISGSNNNTVNIAPNSGINTIPSSINGVTNSGHLNLINRFNTSNVNLIQVNNLADLGNISQSSINSININKPSNNVGQIIIGNPIASTTVSNVQRPLIIGSLQNAIVNNVVRLTTSIDALKTNTDRLSIVNLNSGQNMLQVIGSNSIGVTRQSLLTTNIKPNITTSLTTNISPNKINAATYVKVSGSNQIYQLSMVQTGSKTNQAILLPTSMTELSQQNKIIQNKSIQSINTSQGVQQQFVINQNNLSNQLALKNIHLPQGTVIVGNSIQLPGNVSQAQVMAQINNSSNDNNQKSKVLLINNDAASNILVNNKQGLQQQQQHQQGFQQGLQIFSIGSLSSVVSSTNTTGQNCNASPRLLAPRIITQNTSVRDVQGLLQKLKDHQMQQKSQYNKSINIASAATKPTQIIQQPLNLSQASRIIILNNGVGNSSNLTTSSSNTTLIIRSTPTYNLTPSTLNLVSSSNAILKSQKIVQEAVAKAKAEGICINGADAKKSAKRKGDNMETLNEETPKKRKFESKKKVGEGGSRIEHGEDGSIINEETIDMSDDNDGANNKSRYGKCGKKKKVPTATLR